MVMALVIYRLEVAPLQQSYLMPLPTKRNFWIRTVKYVNWYLHVNLVPVNWKNSETIPLKFLNSLSVLNPLKDLFKQCRKLHVKSAVKQEEMAGSEPALHRKYMPVFSSRKNILKMWTNTLKQFKQIFFLLNISLFCY